MKGVRAALESIVAGKAISRLFALGVVRVVGSSMSPSLQDGDLLFYIKNRLPAEGDIFIFESPQPNENDYLVKRRIKFCDCSDEYLATCPHGIWCAGDNPISLGSNELGAIQVCLVRGSVPGGL